MFRLDRFLTLYFFYPLRRLGNKKNDLQIPILMYHSISERDDKVRHPYYRTNTRPEIFSQHMKYLAEKNYKVISISEAIALTTDDITINQTPISSRRHSVAEQTRYAVITFDDGFSDFYKNAFTVLNKLGFSATVFLPTGFVNHERKQFKGRECLNWDEIRTLSNRGILFGSHTVYHHQLYVIDRKKIESELKQSKEDIEQKIGQRIDTFSYPYAFPVHSTEFVNYLRLLLRQIGYSAGVTTRVGTISKTSDRYFLERLPVNSFDDQILFAAKLQSAYDWLKIPQYYFKKLLA